MSAPEGAAWYNPFFGAERFTPWEDLAMFTFARRPTGLRLAATALLLMTASTRAQLQYRITDLGTLGGPTAGANDINENGRVVGWSTNAAGVQWGFYYDENNRMFRLAHWTNDTSEALGMSNNPEEACGWGINDDGHRRALYWWFDLIAEFITFGGEQSLAHDVNDLAAVVGWAHNAEGLRRPVLWSDRMYDLGPLPGGDEAEARAINNAMKIVGFSLLRSSSVRGDDRATMWHQGRTIDLGTLGGSSSLAEGINELGQVVGVSDVIEAGRTHARAFLWLPEAAYGLPPGMNNLAALSAAEQSHAWHVNDLGAVVGEATQLSSALTTSAFVWTPEQGMLDLNDLIITGDDWHLLIAKSINNQGEIVGTGLLDGITRAYKLTPVP